MMISGTKYWNSVSLFSNTKNIKVIMKQDTKGLRDRGDSASPALFSKLFWKMKVYSLSDPSHRCAGTSTTHCAGMIGVNVGKKNGARWICC